MEIHQDSTIHVSVENKAVVEPYFEPKGFKGGWFEGGRIEVAFFMAAIVMALHSMALRFASDKEQAAYVFAFIAICWTLLASFQLQRALVANSKSLDIADENNITIGTDVAYSDDETSSDLLIDKTTGLRGRPDQIVIIDGEFIPVEQKTGRVPKRPHESHSMQVLAYAHLIETTTGRTPPYGILRYGEEDLHVIDWNEKTKNSLFDRVKTIQEAMAKGGASRNHTREGKCRNCSRRYACPDPLSP
jgi:CRISPR-associated exonuclease Cas4